MYLPVLILTAFFATVHSAQIPCKDLMCPAIYQPVCGSDGKTYSSSCMMRSMTCGDPEPPKVVDNKPCEERQRRCASTVCQEDWSPVCGTDGVTYSNFCYLESKNCDSGVEMAYEGICGRSQGGSDQIACTADWSPVCGTDGVTYSNLCNLKSHTCVSGVEMAYVGECEQSQGGYNRWECTEQWEPICGNNGMTYQNRCYFDAAANYDGYLQVAYNGVCESVQPSCEQTFCTMNYSPVCGDDGKTYGNLCSMTANCSNVKLAHTGEC